MNRTIEVSKAIGSVSTIGIIPKESRNLLVLAHGAGVAMTHTDMEEYAQRLAEVGIATLRFNFPFTENGKKRPDTPKVAHATIAAAVNHAKKNYPEHRIFAGGKSFGGRMSSQAASEGKIEVDGLVFYGFPLHAPGKPSTNRAEHLYSVPCPMLFLAGTRDPLSQIDLITEVTDKLDNGELFVIEDGNHSLRVRKLSGKTNDEVMVEVAKKVRAWMEGVGCD